MIIVFILVLILVMQYFIFKIKEKFILKDDICKNQIFDISIKDVNKNKILRDVSEIMDFKENEKDQTIYEHTDGLKKDRVNQLDFWKEIV